MQESFEFSCSKSYRRGCPMTEPTTFDSQKSFYDVPFLVTRPDTTNSPQLQLLNAQSTFDI